MKHVIGPRGRFIPSVTHPNLLGSYAQDFDRAIGNSWLRMVGLTPDGGKLQESMLRRIKLLVSDGGSWILHMADSAPNSLVASVKEASTTLLAAHSPQLHHHMLSSLGSTDPLGLAHAVRQCTVTLDWLTEHSAILPKNEEHGWVCPNSHSCSRGRLDKGQTGILGPQASAQLSPQGPY